MGAIIDKITEFIKEMLQGWVLDNLETMFTDVNTKVGTIAGEVGQTPSSWNAGVFSMIDNLSDTVMVPIAGMIISAVLCYELNTMVMDKNNMHEMGSEFFFRYLVKACIAVLLVWKRHLKYGSRQRSRNQRSLFSVTCQHRKEMVHLMFMRTSETS